MRSIRFYKFRYWLLENLLSANINENIKHERFINSFFKTQDIIIGDDSFKIKILEKKGDFILGQFGREKLIKVHQDAGTKIEDVKIEDYPYIYFFSKAKLGDQIIYFQTDSQKLIYPSINRLIIFLDLISKSSSV